MTEVGYSGTRFLSVLTARWAVLFDILGIEYLHEPQRFRVGKTVHSPSFFLPSLGDDHPTLTPEGLFIDVQFSPPTEAELQTALTISRHTKRNVCILYGAGMTAGLEWWPILETPLPCFFSQCPFCGRYGISSTSLEDGRPQGRAGVFSHACLEEYKIPERYNILSHCSQDLLITAHSPVLDIAYEAAKAVRFEDRTVGLQVDSARRAVQAVMSTKTYCSPNTTEWIIANALKWAEEKSDFMHFDGAPWWVQHKKDLDAGVTPCTCYSCAGQRRSEQLKDAAKEQPPTDLVQ